MPHDSSSHAALVTLHDSSGAQCHDKLEQLPIYRYLELNFTGVMPRQLCGIWQSTSDTVPALQGVQLYGHGQGLGSRLVNIIPLQVKKNRVNNATACNKLSSCYRTINVRLPASRNPSFLFLAHAHVHLCNSSG